METKNIFKPISFNTEMVNAILENRKTQARRVIKTVSKINHNDFVGGDRGFIKTRGFFQLLLKYDFERAITVRPDYEVGNILWVKESCIEWSGNFQYKPLPFGEELGAWKTPTDMPKEAARIFLKVLNVRAQRLQNISEEDSRKEGVEHSYSICRNPADAFKNYNKINDPFSCARHSFQTLWDSLYAKKHPWKSNPWVWVYDFEKIEKPEDFN